MISAYFLGPHIFLILLSYTTQYCHPLWDGNAHNEVGSLINYLSRKWPTDLLTGIFSTEGSSLLPDDPDLSQGDQNLARTVRDDTDSVRDDRLCSQLRDLG